MTQHTVSPGHAESTDNFGETEKAGHTDHYAPEGLLTRGTVVVVPGRGETRATYARFGRRLAADAYRVRVVDPPRAGAGDPAGSPDAFGARLAQAVAGTADGDGVVRPLVLVGADLGAAAVAALLAREEAQDLEPDGVVLAGLPGSATSSVDTWDAELDVRTSCPTHRGVLSDDAEVRRGSLGEPVPDSLLDAAYEGTVAAPTLLLVGDADPLADHEGLARIAKSLPRARLSLVRGAHHDVLNDVQHRSVAAEVVTFLETVRGGLVPQVVVESSAW
ncbi:alpha/beta hydrolase [Streptomyces sp. NBC_00435]|uniref:alpha/beta hydrolase n=1 Tax=Streptomyces sp. NBC_00435 TaxID=2903649 RepID=UPI002E1F8570